MESKKLNRAVLMNALLAAIAGVVISASSYLVSDSFVRIWLPKIGAYGSAIVRGFPIPYVAYFPSNEASYLYYPLNLAGDIAIWLTVSFLVVSTFTLRRLIFASVCGIVVTTSTLLLSPLALSTPNNAAMEVSGTYMGFPFEYLTRIEGGMLNFTRVSYSFSISNALADYALWTGVALAVFGVMMTVLRSMHHPGESIAPSPPTAEFGQNY